ncbi:hypothetical protein BO221_11855 [Archangium sp. Cb G35]|uniref:hypothetical protein n=1 Tax=Archangium sp. Cb G35 TaxID=1920190 RepID=UPI000936F620|nr:hypothetical protein [Archangium sp. Cb G35]OJT25068.1 hypothetical protein BO221_11855 [Archangium sp. Cb G35]
MSAIRPPEEWKGRFVSTLDVLLFIREQILGGVMPEMFFGKLDVGAVAAFVHGVRFHLYCGGAEDSRYQEFSAWLRDVRNEFPSGKGWAGLYLEEAGGDHRAAILRFLERCAEYHVLARERAT